MPATAQAPSRRSNEDKLPDHAASAALYATDTGKQKSSTYPLDADGKLSSAGAAMSLKRADPRDLPSYPSAGLANKDSSAGAAASLAAANKRSFEHWKPGQIAPANTAAKLANDLKPATQWQPKASAEGSKAALLAHKGGSRVNIWQPDASADGSSAASIAVRSNSKRNSAAKGGVNTESQSKALRAATGAMATRTRSGSLPARSYEYPDSSNSAKNALNAATKATRPSKPTQAPPDDLPGLSSEDATRIHNAAVTNLSRDMYTSTPPVKQEVDERNRKAGLQAAAVSMAKNMYDAQPKVLESHADQDRQSHQAAISSHNRQPSVEPDRREQAMQYLNLQAAAQKLASERLAKLNDESAEYRSYYGTTSPARSRLSLRGRRRSSSDAGLSESDKARSDRIRSEMSLFNSKVAEVDAKKRQKDRDSLLAAAQRNVTKNMQGLDEKVFEETGKSSPAMRADWESKARAKAEAESKSRLQNFGKVDIGGGKYLDQSEVDAIAAAKVQPTLDDITEKAEEQRALDEKRRVEAEDERRIANQKAAEEKERNKNTKHVWKQFKAQEKEEKQSQQEEEQAQKIYEATAIEQDRKAEAFERQQTAAETAKAEQEREEKTKEEWKRFKDEEKKAKKAKKEEEKAKKAEEKRKSRGASFAAMAAAIGIGETEKEKDKETSKSELKGKSPEPIDLQPQTIAEEVSETKPADDVAVMSEPEEPLLEQPKELPIETPKASTLQTTTAGTSKPVVTSPGPASPTGETSPKEQGRVSSWLKSKFGRRASRSGKDNEGAAPSKVTKSTVSAPIHIDKQPTEPITNLPVDPSKATPGFGTDNIPHIAAAAENDDKQLEEGESTKPTTSIEPITGLPIDTSKTNPGFGTDEIPHTINRNSAVPSEAITGADTASTTYSSTVPDPHQSRTNTNNSEREIALAGRSGPHHQHPITTASDLGGATETDENELVKERRDSADSSSISSLSSSDEDAEPFGTTTSSSAIPVSPLPAGAGSASSGPIIGSTAPRGRTTRAAGTAPHEVSPIETRGMPGAVGAYESGLKETEHEETRAGAGAGAGAGAAEVEGEEEGEGEEKEEFEEARDAFDTEGSLPLPKPRFAEEGKMGAGAGGRGRGSPVRETRFIEEL